MILLERFYAEPELSQSRASALTSCCACQQRVCAGARDLQRGRARAPVLAWGVLVLGAYNRTAKSWLGSLTRRRGHDKN
jgi:hypothetical protein